MCMWCKYIHVSFCVLGNLYFTLFLWIGTIIGKNVNPEIEAMPCITSHTHDEYLINFDFYDWKIVKFIKNLYFKNYSVYSIE